MNYNKFTNEPLSLPSNDDNARNSLKLDQLSEMGLDIFSDYSKFNSNLKNSTLESMLLDDSSTYSNEYDSIHCITEDIDSGSSTPQGTELIEVFPVADSSFVDQNDALVTHKQKIDSDEPLGSKGQTLRNKSMALVTKRPSRENVAPQRLVPKSKMKKGSVNNEYKTEFRSPVTPLPILNEDSSSLLYEYDDNTELENKINDSLLDMLQEKMGVTLSSSDCFRPKETNANKDRPKWITISPTNPDGKTINLSVNGKICRSKEPLTETELRLVMKVLNYENTCSERDSVGSFKNVYYDPETDTNIRYEVMYTTLPPENITGILNINKKNKYIDSATIENGLKTTEKEQNVLNSVARTRCGRISRPPRYVIRDYKRLKGPGQTFADVDEENEKSGGYPDYQCNEKSLTADPLNSETHIDLYGPLEPNKRQFSSLSRCPSCDKVYLGYHRMAVHFQKYPDHKNEELLKQLLLSARKKLGEGNQTFPGIEDRIENAPSNSEELRLSSTSLNGSVKKKKRVHRKFRMRGPRCNFLKEVLSTNKVENVVKYATPVIARVLSSFDYVVRRSKRIKKDNETLASVLLRELSIILKQIHTISQDILKPVSDNDKNSANIFSVEKEDVLQYVLGLSPGKYVTSDNEDWAMEFISDELEEKKACLKDEYAALCSSIIDEKSFSLQDSHNDKVNFECNVIEYQDRLPTEISDPFSEDDVLSDLSHITEKEILPAKNVDYMTGDQACEVELNIKKTKNVESLDSQMDYITSFEDTPFSPNQTSNFSPLVDEAGGNIIDDFSLGLPILSDTLNNTKDCLYLLEKPIEINENSSIPSTLTLPNPHENPSHSLDTNLDTFFQPNETSFLIDFKSKDPVFH